MAWARYIISFLVEASDNKVRVAGHDSRPTPTPCPFPDHEPNCANAPLAAGLCLDGIDGAPVLVIERENDVVRGSVVLVCQRTRFRGLSSSHCVLLE